MSVFEKYYNIVLEGHCRSVKTRTTIIVLVYILKG